MEQEARRAAEESALRIARGFYGPDWDPDETETELTYSDLDHCDSETEGYFSDYEPTTPAYIPTVSSAEEPVPPMALEVAVKPEL
jgi:hypothetical protein